MQGQVKCLKCKLEYKGKIIEYTLYRKDVKNINVRINRDGSISISANKNISVNYIEFFVKSKWDWIIKNLKIIKDRNIKNETNELYNWKVTRLLGKQYKIEFHKCNKNYVYKNHNLICIYTKDINNISKNKDIYEKWLRNVANEIFNESIDRMYKFLEPYGAEKPELFIRKMKSRWGSCFKFKNKINLNLYLVKSSLECIDYVVLHELTHLVHFNHSKDFYNLLTKFMPDWQYRKKILNEIIIS